MHHIFVVENKRFSIPNVLVFAIYAVLSLKSNPKVQAINLLRHVMPCGLAEAKWIVDYIAEHATLDDRGIFNIYRKPMVQYLGMECPQETRDC